MLAQQDGPCAGKVCEKVSSLCSHVEHDHARRLAVVLAKKLLAQGEGLLHDQLTVVRDGRAVPALADDEHVGRPQTQHVVSDVVRGLPVDLLRLIEARVEVVPDSFLAPDAEEVGAAVGTRHPGHGTPVLVDHLAECGAVGEVLEDGECDLTQHRVDGSLEDDRLDVALHWVDEGIAIDITTQGAALEGGRHGDEVVLGNCGPAQQVVQRGLAAP